jgi:D-alanyl-D-alanine carboxypeptidase/D-alanyl-D-alanine-endopeptidase (penicillin-binding protein 4)
LSDVLRARIALSAALLALLWPAAGVGAPSATPQLAPSLRQALASRDVSLGKTGAIAIDLATGTTVFAHNATLPLVPASNEKLPVAWAALVRLGPAYRFHTEVYGVGTRVGPTWNGDLVLKGFGDPTLTTADLDALARRVARMGIRTVAGRVRGDESTYDAKRGVSSWKASFAGFESPPLSALVVDRADGWPALSPPLLAARAFRDALLRQGVDVTGSPGLGVADVARATALARDVSPPLAEILRFMNRESDNFTAEMLLKHLGLVATGRGTTRAGATVVSRAMRDAGIDMAGVRIVDGSGLSSSNRLTALALVELLAHAHATPAIRPTFVSSLAVTGKSGTLRNRLLALAGIVHGKTGTTDVSCTLSGFVAGRYAFAVLENGNPVAWWAARTAQDRFVTLLAGS